MPVKALKGHVAGNMLLQQTQPLTVHFWTQSVAKGRSPRYQSQGWSGPTYVEEKGRAEPSNDATAYFDRLRRPSLPLCLRLALACQPEVPLVELTAHHQQHAQGARARVPTQHTTTPNTPRRPNDVMARHAHKPSCAFATPIMACIDCSLRMQMASRKSQP